MKNQKRELKNTRPKLFYETEALKTQFGVKKVSSKIDISQLADEINQMDLRNCKESLHLFKPRK